MFYQDTFLAIRVRGSFGVKRLGVLCYFDTLLCQRADDSYINISFNLRSVSIITPVIEN